MLSPSRKPLWKHVPGGAVVYPVGANEVVVHSIVAITEKIDSAATHCAALAIVTVALFETSRRYKSGSGQTSQKQSAECLGMHF